MRLKESLNCHSHYAHMSSGKPWKWTRRFAVGLSASVAGFSAFNFIAPFLPGTLWGIPIPDLVAALLLASIVGNAQGLANCMAANARRVGAAGHTKAGKWCWAFCVGFAAVSWFGLHNAWEMVRESATGFAFPPALLMDALFAFIAMSEPTMNWVVDLLKGLQQAEERASEKAWRDDAAEREARQREADERRKAFHAVGVAIPAAALAAASPTGNFPLEPITHSAPASADEQAHASHGWRGPRDQVKWELVKEAHRRGMSPMEIVEDTGIPSTTVYRWLAHLNANGKEAAA